MEKKSIRMQVEKLREDTAFGGKAEDCFPAWYLIRKYQLPESVAFKQSADAGQDGGLKGWDSGIDAFHLTQPAADTPPLLTIIQAKYSEATASVANGLKDLKKSLKVLPGLIQSAEPAGQPENKIIVNLRAALNKLAEVDRGRVSLEFVVLHLCSEDEDHIQRNTSRARMELKEEIEQVFPDGYRIAQVGPQKMWFEHDEFRTPAEWATLNIVATPCEASHDGMPATMHYGIGRLHELVELYNLRRGQLFAKNVRYFLSERKNVERGPSGRMKETLQKIAILEETRPEIFAFLHNGVTIYAEDLRTGNGACHLREAYVLNGCQTIKTAHRFLTDPKNKARVKPDVWRQIPVPVRILATRNQELVRQVTIGNNRQNAIRPADLRANEDEQIRLEHRFHAAGIFYERQRDAFSDLRSTAPERLESEFPHTNDRCVNIEDLARSICAAAGGRDLYYTRHPEELFENDEVYRRCFGPSRTESLRLLTFLQNLHDVLGVVLKKDLGLVSAPTGPKPARFLYHVMCLLVRYLAKEARYHSLIVSYGQQLLGTKKPFREWVATMLDNYHSRIKRELQNRFLALESADASQIKQAFEGAEIALSLQSTVAVFDVLADLDYREASRAAQSH